MREVEPPFVCAVIPCYNLAGVCGPIVRAAADQAQHVIAVDDGSTDETGSELERVARESGGRVELLRFAGNRGKGVALLEAFRHALARVPFDLLVTLDGDGQHQPADLSRLASALVRERAALVIGERRNLAAMPWRSRFGNRLTTALLRCFYAGTPFDTQSGMRALDRDFVVEITRLIKGRRYETELQILLLALEQRRRIATIPIPTLYFNGNRRSHFHPILDSWRIYQTLWLWRITPLKSAAPRG